MRLMRDIHSHVLYNIDDGSKNIEESIGLLKELEKSGVEEIILTPHYIENSKYVATVSQKQEQIEELQKNTNIKLYIGNEVYISKNVLELLESKKISTLNNSRYLLIELPMSSKIRNLDEIIYNLVRNNIIPIIAHPERYLYVQSDIKYLDKFVDMGVLFQSNYGSILGIYGKKAKKTIKLLLKNNYITFLGSDIHSLNKKIDIKKASRKIKRIIKDENYFDDITSNNIKKVIDDVEI